MAPDQIASVIPCFTLSLCASYIFILEFCTRQQILLLKLLHCKMRSVVRVKFLVLLLRDVHGFVSSYLCVDGSCFACYIIRNSNWVESTFNISSPYLSLIHIQSILVKKLVCAEFGALCKVDFQITCETCSVNVSNSQEVRNFQLPIQLV